MEEEVKVTEMAVEEPIGSSARQELEALLNQQYPEEERTGDVDQMALDWIKGQIEMNERLSQALGEDPKVAQVFADVVNGEKGAASIVRYFGKELLNAEEGTPEYTALMQADDDYRKEREQMDADKLNSETKMEQWFAGLKDYCERKNLNYDVYVVKLLDKLVNPLFELEVSDENFDRYVMSVDYEKDVEDAFEAGEIKGRNMNINELRGKPSDGMPIGLSSQASIVEKPKRRMNSLIADALNA